MEQAKNTLPGLGELFRSSWEAYKVRAGQLALMVLLSLVAGLGGLLAGGIVLAIGLAIAALGSGAAGGGSGFIPGLIAAAPLPIIFAIIVGVLVAMVLSIYVKIMMTMVAIEKPGQDFGQLMHRARPFFWPMVGVSLLAGFVIYGGFLLIVPGIFFAVALSFVGYVVITEDARGFAALQRSRELVRGVWWPVLGRIFLLAAGWGVAGILVQEVAAKAELFSVYVIWQLLGAFIFTPFFLVYTTEIWRQLVVRNGARKGDMAERWKYQVPFAAGVIMAILIAISFALAGFFAAGRLVDVLGSWSGSEHPFESMMEDGEWDSMMGDQDFQLQTGDLDRMMGEDSMMGDVDANLLQ